VMFRYLVTHSPSSAMISSRFSMLSLEKVDKMLRSLGYVPPVDRTTLKNRVQEIIAGKYVTFEKLVTELGCVARRDKKMIRSVLKDMGIMLITQNVLLYRVLKEIKTPCYMEVVKMTLGDRGYLVGKKKLKKQLEDAGFEVSKTQKGYVVGEVRHEHVVAPREIRGPDRDRYRCVGFRLIDDDGEGEDNGYDSGGDFTQYGAPSSMRYAIGPSTFEPDEV